MPNTEDMRHTGGSIKEVSVSGPLSYITTDTFLSSPDLYGLCFLSFLPHRLNCQKCVYYILCCHSGSWRGSWPSSRNSCTDNYHLDPENRQQCPDVVALIAVVVRGFSLAVYLRLFFHSFESRLSRCFGGCTITIPFSHRFFPPPCSSVRCAVECGANDL